ncbi:MAG: hypothetical protein WC764_02545 [Candidatus Paceibacterota bacterium]|jgi:hypothetical protein
MNEAGAFLLGFVALMIAMFFVWLAIGGPAKYEREHPGAFLTSPAPLGTGESFGTLLHPLASSTNTQ